MEAQTGKYLANPSVEFESLWGGAERIRNSELTVMQAFDFPSAYASRNKIAKLRSSYYDTEGAALRQQLLLDAKTLCIQIVHLNRMKEFLSERVVNAERLDSAYRRKFAIGEANILECNKIGVELISAKTEYNLNEAELLAKCQQLATLTGTESDRFSGLVYPTVESLPAFEQLSALYMEQNPQVQSLQQQVSVDKQSVSLNRSLSLPKFEMGYRHDFGGVQGGNVDSAFREQEQGEGRARPGGFVIRSTGKRSAECGVGAPAVVRPGRYAAGIDAVDGVGVAGAE